MASQTFSLDGAADVSATVLLATGEIGRVRFTQFPAGAEVELGITRNSVTSYAPISSDYQHGDEEVNNRAVFMDCGLPGDTLFVRATTKDATPVTGIVEGVPVP